MQKKQTEPLKTIATILVGLLTLFILSKKDWLLDAIVVSGGIGLLFPAGARWMDAAWMKLAALMGLIMPKLILSVIFFLFLCPLAFLARLFKKQDSLFLSGKGNSTFLTMTKTFGAKDLKKPW